MTKYNHLSKEQRDDIQYYLKEGRSFTFISKCINVDRTTISKEIRRNRYVNFATYLPFDKTRIKHAVYGCEKLSKPPYVCNGCNIKNACPLKHLYYNSKLAQKHYEEVISNVKTGVNITKEEIAIINKNIVPLVKNKNQSVNQIYINHPDILYFSKVTFYKYVNDGVIKLCNLDLPRRVKFKKRKKTNRKNKRDIAILIGRTYEDYQKKIKSDCTQHIWQMDTVVGKQKDNKVLMTMLLVETNYMLIRLLDKKTVENVNLEITKLKTDLGIELYKKYINIVLTDNGTEFYDPFHIELDLDTGEVISSVYYCQPNSPHQKAELEKNHEYIRYILPKGSSFETLTKENVKKIEDNINNVPREILGNISPYELTKQKFPDLLKALNGKYINPDDVNLSDSIFKN